LINDLRVTDVVRELSVSGNYKSYNSLDKSVLIEDKNYNKLIDLKLVSDYTTYVGSGDSTKVAEFLLIDYKDGIELFDDLYFFDKNNDYSSQVRDYDLKYGVDYLVEECQLLPELEKEVEYCQNVTKTDWILFNSLSELPHKNIKIGLFTDTTLGDKVEWVSIIQGFDVLVWAAWDVTSGTKFEFAPDATASYNSLVKIDDTHYLNAYEPANAVVLIVNQTDWTITKGTIFNVANDGIYNSLVQIDSTHYLHLYQGDASDGYAVVLIVNQTDWTITKGTPIIFSDIGTHFSLAKINSTHYLCTFADNQDRSGIILIVDIDDWTITNTSIVEFDANPFVEGSLMKIDDNHYLSTYAGLDNDGYAVIIAVTGTTITNGTPIEHDTGYGRYNSLGQIDSTHFINAYFGTDGDGYARIFTVNTEDDTVSAGTAYEFDDYYGGYHSLVQIDSTHYLNAYRGTSGFNGQSIVLIVNQTDWTITNGTAHEFDTSAGKYNSLVQIDSTHYLNAYAGLDDDGYAIVLIVEIPSPPADTCTCPGINQNHIVNLTHYCNLTSCNLGTGKLSFIDIGFANCNGTINTTDLGDPGNGGTLYIQSDCEIIIN